MIKSFWHKGLLDLFEIGDTKKIRQDLKARARERLLVLHAARKLRDLDIPGYNTHPLATKPLRHAVKVSGPWRITFEWVEPDAWRVDLEQCH